MLRNSIEELRRQSAKLAEASPELRTGLLRAFADGIERDNAKILAANAEDLRSSAGKISQALLDRLALSASKISEIVKGIRQLAEMPDPVGKPQGSTELDTGLELERVSIPLGVVAVIFESRPDVLPQVISLAVRSGNGIILKGGQESSATNRAIMSIFSGLSETDPRFPSGIALLVDGREAVRELLEFEDLIDLVIPRGSNELVRHIMDMSRIPVLGHAAGVCHLYIHQSAQVEKAIGIASDAKTQYPAACNSVETILVDREIASRILPDLASTLRAKGTRILGCGETVRMLGLNPDDMVENWSTEYGDLTVAIKITEDLSSAIEHINSYGSHHTDAIVSEDTETIENFLRRVDSASVFSNCSTRFADGFRFGFGAEVGIGTGKLHARGPVGIEGLLTYKYKLRGSGQVVQSYTGSGARPFTHRKISGN